MERHCVYKYAHFFPELMHVKDSLGSLPRYDSWIPILFYEPPLFLKILLCSVCYSTCFGKRARVLEALSQNRLIIKDCLYLNQSYLGRTKEWQYPWYSWLSLTFLEGAERVKFLQKQKRGSGVRFRNHRADKSWGWGRREEPILERRMESWATWGKMRLFAYNSRWGRKKLSADTQTCNEDKKPHKRESEPCKTCA